MGSDLKLMMCRALKSAKSSIYLTTYGLNDADVLGILEKSSATKHVIADARQCRKNAMIERVKKSGLNHAKIALIDDIAYIGSANSTPSSLEMHDNFVMRIHSKEFCQLLQKNCFEERSCGQFQIQVGDQPLEIWLTPKVEAQDRIEELIDSAKKSIKVAMFTLSNRTLIGALERARARGVDVKIITDRYTKSPPIQHIESKGPQLLHYKWGLIDEEVLISGSANWTRAAFDKNREIVVILPLNPKQSTYCQRLWKKIYAR